MQQTKKLKEKKKRKAILKRERKRRNSPDITWQVSLGRLVEYDNRVGSLHVEGQGAILSDFNHNLATIIRDYLLSFSNYQGCDFCFPAPMKELSDEEYKSYEKEFRDKIKAVAREFDEYNKTEDRAAVTSACVKLGELLPDLCLL